MRTRPSAVAFGTNAATDGKRAGEEVSRRTEKSFSTGDETFALYFPDSPGKSRIVPRNPVFFPFGRSFRFFTYFA